MYWSDITIKPVSRTLRQFASLWLVFFGGWAGWLGLVKVQVPWGMVFGATAVVVGFVGVLWPQRIRWIYVGWMLLVFPVGWTVTHTLLAIVFYLIFAPMGLVFRLRGRDRLNRRKKFVAETYWTAKPEAKDVRAYFRQY